MARVHYGSAKSRCGSQALESDFRFLTIMRYYEQKYPEVDELVMVQVRQIAEMGAYVKLVHIRSRLHR